MDNKKFGAFISQMRKERGMTQADLAEKLHVTNKAISKWETGAGFPDIKLLEPLADALEISIVELMKSECNEVTKENYVDDIDVAMKNTMHVLEESRRKERRNIFVVCLSLILIYFFLILLDYISFVSFILCFLPFVSFFIGICLLILTIIRFCKKEAYKLTLLCSMITIVYPIFATVLVAIGFWSGSAR